MYNFTNPGTISHNQILDLYKQYIDPAFTYTNFSLEEQSKILAAGRSNNELDSSKLVETCRGFGVEIPPIQESIVGVFERMRENLKKWVVCSSFEKHSNALSVFTSKTSQIITRIPRYTSHTTLHPFPLRLLPRTFRTVCTSQLPPTTHRASSHPILPRSSARHRTVPR